MCQVVQFIKLVAIITIALVCLSGCGKQQQPTLDYKEHIKQNLRYLKDNPDSCLHIQQVAASYQAIRELDKAISYYETLLSKCPGGHWEIEGKWQLGLTYISIGEIETGLSQMDDAIELAKDTQDLITHKQYLEQKQIIIQKHINKSSN